ncbi:MAG: SDR family oxidoreductase [Lachnospiraceae bacterium]|nr:SDR family oxidoreductase [Lachnospiraceae bacterium]
MLKNKNVIVTGAGGGIGLATVNKIAENGGNVWACTRTKTEQFEQDLQNIANQYGVWIKAVYFDMTNESQMKTAIKEISLEKRSIDVLVNAAGTVYNGMFTMTSISKLKEVFEVNYFEQIYIMQLVARLMMRQKKGSIVNVASVSGIETTEGKLAYGSSKAALIYASKTISKELAQYNIRVNALAPGLTDTKMNKEIPDADLQKVLDRSSMKRMANPEEIANAIVFLASDQSSFMTGQVMVVDGGRLWS